MKTYQDYANAVKEVAAAINPQLTKALKEASQLILKQFKAQMKPQMDAIKETAIAAGILKMAPEGHPWEINVRNDEGRLHFQARPAYTKAPRVYNRAVIDVTEDPTVAYQVAQAIALGGHDTLRASFAGANKPGATPTSYLIATRVGAENKVSIPGVGEVGVPEDLFEPLPIEIVEAPQQASTDGGAIEQAVAEENNDAVDPLMALAVKGNG